MLVLARKPGQKILIPSVNLTITILEIRGSVIRVGVSAPPHVSIIREELVRPPSACQNDGTGSSPTSYLPIPPCR